MSVLSEQSSLSDNAQGMSGMEEKKVKHSNKFTIEDFEGILNLPACVFTQGTDDFSQLNTEYQKYDQGSFESLLNDQTIEKLWFGINNDFNNTLLGNGTMHQLSEMSQESYKRETFF